MRVVVALGGRALPTARTERATVRLACRALAPLARQHELVVCHGNGPQAKVRAACSFVEQTGGMAAIGSIRDAVALLACEAGAIVSLDGVVYAA